jgi:hypothetical protein
MIQVIIGMAAGILLGLRWKCFVLFPTLFVIVVMMICIGGVNWSNLGQMFLAITAIQGGYLCGGGRAAARWQPSIRQ